MPDKFFDTARDRFEFHRQNIERDLSFLEYMHYDHIQDLPPDFKTEIDAMKASLKRMEELVNQLKG